MDLSLVRFAAAYMYTVWDFIYYKAYLQIRHANPLYQVRVSHFPNLELLAD